VGIVTTLIKGDVFNWGQIMDGAGCWARGRSVSMPPDGLHIAGLTARTMG